MPAQSGHSLVRNPLCSSHLDQISRLRRGLGQNPMMDGEERQLQAVGYSCLVVDPAEIVFDDLLFRSQLKSDLLVLAALYDQRDDLHFFGGKAIAHTGSDAVGGMDCRHVGSLHEALTASNSPHAVDQITGPDVSAYDTIHA